jgi:hypothetical protein
MEPYADSIEHLRAELMHLDLLIQRALILGRSSESAAGPDELRGLVISEPEIAAMVRSKDFFGERWHQEELKQAELHPIDRQLYHLREAIDARRALSRHAGVYLALPSLAQRFELSPAEVDVLLVALAPELEPHYETLYAYLQNDVTRKRPSINLALNLICRSEREKLEARCLFDAEARLLRHRLLDLGEEPQDRQPPLLRKFLKMDEAVVGFLLDQSPRAARIGTLLTPERRAEPPDVSPSTQKRLENLATVLYRTAAEGVVVRLIGAAEGSLRAAAERLCAALDHRLLLVELSHLEGDEARLATLMRNAVLWQAVLAVSAGEPPDHEAEIQRVAQTEACLWSGLRDFREPVLLLGPPHTFLHIPPETRVWHLEVEAPDFTLRLRAWETALSGRTSGVDPGRLADTFQFGGQRIHQTLDLATSLAVLRDPSDATPSTQDLLEAGRALTTPHLGHLASRVEPRYTWPDIVLPPDKVQQLHSIAAWMKFRRVVHRDWGFGLKLSRGRGLNVLFTGPSGTGKTMAAEVLAGELALDLFQIDLSSVVSKYIGETEKNLGAIFREAEQSQALLFFDEADALFGKRTEVKDAHDRYANIEVNYLLQRVEQYDGVVILATNLQRNLDEAFLRRMQEVVDFPFPDEALRERIWLGHFPSEAPREDDIDFAFLAQQFKFTGGNIKNIVLHAAFLAAQESQPIAMQHLILATKAEFQKQGKLCVKADFGPYYELVHQKD